MIETLYISNDDDKRRSFRVPNIKLIGGSKGEILDTLQGQVECLVLAFYSLHIDRSDPFTHISPAHIRGIVA